MPSLTARARDVLQAYNGFVPAEQLSKLEIRDYDYGSIKVRGIGSRGDIPTGKMVLSVPIDALVTSGGLQDGRFAGATEAGKIGLWLAEKKLELDNHAGVTLTPEESRQAVWVKAYPSLEEIRDSGGGPFVTPPEVLDKWAKLPKIGVIKAWTDSILNRLRADVEKYNTARGSHPELDYKTAVWGYSLANSRNYHCRGSATFAPVGDFFNHAGHKSQLGLAL